MVRLKISAMYTVFAISHSNYGSKLSASFNLLDHKSLNHTVGLGLYCQALLPPSMLKCNV